MQPRQIVVVGTHYDPVRQDQTGGIGIGGYRIAKALALQGVDVRLVCTGDSVVGDLTSLGVVVHLLSVDSQTGTNPMMGKEEYDELGRRFYAEVGAVLQSIRYDRVIFNAAYEHALGIKDLTKGQINMVHVPYGKNPWGERYPICELGLRNVAVSIRQYQAGYRYYAAGIDNPLPWATDEMPIIGRKNWLPKSAIFLGRLLPEKGPDLAIAACSVLRACGCDIQVLHLCGDDDGGEFGRKLREELPKWVSYHGSVDANTRDRLLRGSDIGFFTSNPRNDWQEAFGHEAAEMLAFGVPVVGFDKMGFLSDYARADTAVVLPWEEDFEKMYGGNFAAILASLLLKFKPNPHMCQESMRALTLDRYGARLLKIVCEIPT